MAKILIVDDASVARAQLKKDLESGGHSVVEAIDGQNGLEIVLQNSDIQLIISDVNMPRMDGITMSKAIHEHSNFAKLPILVISTEATQDMKQKGKEAGVLAWMIKPYNATKLLEAIKKIIK